MGGKRPLTHGNAPLTFTNHFGFGNNGVFWERWSFNGLTLNQQHLPPPRLPLLKKFKPPKILKLSFYTECLWAFQRGFGGQGFPPKGPFWVWGANLSGAIIQGQGLFKKRGPPSFPFGGDKTPNFKFNFLFPPFFNTKFSLFPFSKKTFCRLISQQFSFLTFFPAPPKTFKGGGPKN